MGLCGLVRPKGLEPSTPKLKVSYSTIWVTSAYGGFSHFRVFPCLVIIHTTNNPTLYANCALLLGNILGAFFNVVAPIHDVELVKGIEPSLSDWKSEVLPLNYTCIREVVLTSFPSRMVLDIGLEPIRYLYRGIFLLLYVAIANLTIVVVWTQSLPYAFALR